VRRRTVSRESAQRVAEIKNRAYSRATPWSGEWENEEAQRVKRKRPGKTSCSGPLCQFGVAAGTQL
jgi:hypothetical protein